MYRRLLFSFFAGVVLGISACLGYVYSIDVGSVAQVVQTDSVVSEDTFSVTIGTTRFPVTLAVDTDARMRGLSGTESLPVGTGKLFVFETADTHAFWMKDMHYAIDMLWFTAEGRLVHIQPYATPASYPQLFAPQEPALYVLELNAGESARNGLQLGDRMQLSESITNCLAEDCYIE